MFATNAYPEFLHEGEELVTKIVGEIDHHSAKGLREEIDLVIRRCRPSVLTLDLAGVTFMDSSGLGLVLGRISLLESLGGRMEIVHSSERVQKIFKMAGISRIRNVTLR